jgi:hypothetical protein
MQQTTITTNYINAVSQHIGAGKTLRNALAKLKPTYDKATFDEQQVLRMQVAQLIGKESGVKPVITNRGSVSFPRDTKAGDASRKMLDYYLPTTLKTKAKPKVSKQVDIVEKLLSELYALPKAQQQRFIKLLKADSK